MAYPAGYSKRPVETGESCSRSPGKERLPEPVLQPDSLKLNALLEHNVPYDPKVTFHPDGRAGALGAAGWAAPEPSHWLETAPQAASNAHFGAPTAVSGRATRSR